MKQVPFIVKENFLSDDEFRLVAQESERLMKYLRDGKFSRPAKTEDGKILKQNKGLSYDDHYENAAESSDTVKILKRKLFDENLFSEFEDQTLVDLSQTIDWAGMMMSYYENEDHYKRHFDGSFITGLLWIDVKPRKYMGGEFLLYNGTNKDNPDRAMTFQPVNNRFIAFPGCYLHEVRPVVMSERWNGLGHGRFCISVFCGHKSA